MKEENGEKDLRLIDKDVQLNEFMQWFWTLNTLVFDLSWDKLDEELIKEKTDLILENESLKREIDLIKFEKTD